MRQYQFLSPDNSSISRYERENLSFMYTKIMITSGEERNPRQCFFKSGDIDIIKVTEKFYPLILDSTRILPSMRQYQNFNGFSICSTFFKKGNNFFS